MVKKRTVDYDAFLAAAKRIGEQTDYSCMAEGLQNGGVEGLKTYGEFLSNTMETYSDKDPKEQEFAFFKIVSFGLMVGLSSIKTLLEATPDEWARKYLAFITTNLVTATAVHSGVVQDEDLGDLKAHIALLSPQTVRGILGGPVKEETPQEGAGEEEIMNLPEGFMDGLQKYFSKDREGETFHRALGEIFRRT